MKHIVKLSEPQELIDWKAADKMYQRGNPKWKRVDTTVKNIVKENLRKEQGGICCYCERRLIENDYHTEHLKPIFKFPDIQIEYDNLLCSCQFEIEKGEPRHCGNSKGSWFDESLFISPLSEDCEEKFKYTFDGQIEPADENEQAATTIEKLRLNLDKLIDDRKKAIEPFLNLDLELTEDELNDFVDAYLVDKNENGGNFNEFYTTIKYLFTS